MILAIDPGLGSCGYALVRPRTARVIDLGVLTSSPTQGVDEHTDRARRAAVQAGLIADLADKHDCTVIAAEAMSFGGPPKARHAMAVSLSLCWGVLAGIANGMGIGLLEVSPKQWQHAITPGVTKINYDNVFEQLRAFVDGQATVALHAIKKQLRNHALDAVGVGVFAALLPAVRIHKAVA